MSARNDTLLPDKFDWVLPARYDLLLHHAADIEVDVTYEDLGQTRHGEYRHFKKQIALNVNNTAAQMVAALAHELGHALGCEFGQRVNCRRADEVGASIAITTSEYAAVEAEVGEHPGAQAEALVVTRRLILGWRRWFEHTQPPAEREGEFTP